MQNTFFTSDLHFGHANIIEYCNRPWTKDQQEQELIDRWNSKVGLMDDVYHLGDFTFAGSKKFKKYFDIINELNGQITFIRGNHDQDSLWNLISDAHEDGKLLHVKEISYYKEISVLVSGPGTQEIGVKQKIILSHFPFTIWNMAHHGAWHLHGHTHGSFQGNGKIFDVGIDNHPDHQVFSLAEIKAIMDTKQYVAVDHHEEGGR